MVTISSEPNRTFRRGRGVYTCATCGRRTREVSVEGSDDCEDCFDLAGLQNSVWDGCFTEHDVPERDRILARIVDRGGDGARVKAAFRDLFA